MMLNDIAFIIGLVVFGIFFCFTISLIPVFVMSRYENYMKKINNKRREELDDRLAKLIAKELKPLREKK